MSEAKKTVPANQPPSVGRVVHYYDGTKDSIHGEELQPLAAFIIAVKDADAGLVNLTYFTASGLRKTQQDAPYSEKPTLGHWGWIAVVPPRSAAGKASTEVPTSPPIISAT